MIQRTGRTVSPLLTWLLLAAPAIRAETLSARTVAVAEDKSWEVLEVRAAELPRLSAEQLESGTFWDLRPAPGAGRIVRWSTGADHTLCADEMPAGTRRGCRLLRGPLVIGSNLPGEAFSADEVRSTLGAAPLISGTR